MRKTTATLLAVIAALLSTSASAETDNPFLNWVAANSPHGFDVTPDGTIWINLYDPGLKDDYAVRAQDLKMAHDVGNKTPTFWIRGYHKRNPQAVYRESKAKMRLDCQGETITTLQTSYYRADGDLVSSSGYGQASYIVPGTYAAEYQRLFCLAP